MMRDKYTKARADEYLRIYGPPDDPRPAYLLRMKEIISMIPNGSVLDVACGMGHLYGQIRRSDYLGVDSSEAMIDLAQRYFPEGHFRVVDAFELEVVDPRKTVASTSFLIHLEPMHHQMILQKMWDHCTEALVFTIPIDIDQTTFTYTESQPEPTLITTISQTTFGKLCSGLKPPPRIIDMKRFSVDSFGGASSDRLVRLIK